MPPDDPITVSVLCNALSGLLLSISGIFDLESATPDQLQSTGSIVTTCANGAIARLFTFYELPKNEAVSFNSQLWPWVEENSAKVLPWLKLVDQMKWPTTKRLSSPAKVSSSSPRKSDSAGEPQRTLSFRFSPVDGGSLSIGELQALKLLDLLIISSFTKLLPQTMYDTFVQHTGDGLLEEETFLEAIEELISMTDMSHLMHEGSFLDQMIDLFRCYLPDQCLKVDAFEIAAGFSLLTWGSKSDKLSAAFHYFDADSKGFLNRQQLWRFVRSILILLLHFSPPADGVVQRYGSLAELVDTGEQEIMDMITDGIDEGYEDYDDDEDDMYEDDATQGDEELQEESRALANSDLRSGMYTFEDFGLWYNTYGHKIMSWFELLDLTKWIFVSPKFKVEHLDVKPVDPVMASTNYYTANNIQVDVDGENSGDINDLKNQAYLTFADVIAEEDEEDDVSTNGRPYPPPPPAFSESSFTSTVTDQRSSQRSRNSSIPSTLPAICLKNEIVLEFDLPFDADDDAITELPLTTLSFDNGDLIQYFELQRVIKFHTVPLYRLFEVFEPYMENPSTACIEKSVFEACVRKLLPGDVAASIAGAFGVHTNTRVPPPSVGRSKDSKMVADILSRLFFAFNRGGTGKIDLIEFASAFTIFCAGSKSEKLAFAYRLFDADQDGCLTRREMWKFLRAFLTMLLALGNGAELSAEAIASVADTSAIEIADCIFKDTNKTYSTRNFPPAYGQGRSHRLSLDEAEEPPALKQNPGRRDRSRYEHRGSLPDAKNIALAGAASNAAGAGAGRAFVRGGVVSFEEFARWYSTNGYSLIAWIELLDTKKWPEVNSSVTEAILKYVSRQQHALELVAQRQSAGPAESDFFSDDTEASNDENDEYEKKERSSSLENFYPESNMPMMKTDNPTTIDRNAMVAGMDTVSGIAHLITSPPNSSTSAKDLSSVALQFKLTSYDNTVLRIRLKDVAIVYTISERLNFSSMTCGDLSKLLNQHAQGRALTKRGYLRAMRQLVPRDELSNEDQEFLSFHLLRIFTLFESESVIQDDSDSDEQDQTDDHTRSKVQKSSSVDKLQLLAGMSIFCGTSKSAKLGVLFKLIGAQENGFVSRRHLFELLKSILVVLFAFSSFNTNKSHTNDTTTTSALNTNSAAERAASAVISKLFCEAKCRYTDSISLAEFAAWYAAGGYMDCPWLELLDLSKWPAKEAFAASKREKPLIYAFDMQDEGNILHFTESDISTYLFMIRSTKLGDLSVSKIYDALLAYATPSAEEARKLTVAASKSMANGQLYSYGGPTVEEDEGAYMEITRSNFYECIRSLVSKEGMSEKAQQTSSKLLSRIFNVFDRKRCGRVNALELVCGMSILGKGSKSQKLMMAFDFITKMRQQRNRTLNNFASTMAQMGGGGYNSTSTGGAAFGLNSFRAPMSMATGLRRSMLQTETNALPHSVLFIYLRSFLLSLMALSDGTYRLGLEKIYVEADDFIEEAMGDLMTDVSNTGTAAVATTGGFASYGNVRSRARVTFEQFGEWYNTSGYELISWVELLDVQKWQEQHDVQEQVATATAGRTKSRRVVGMGSQRPGNQHVSMNAQPLQSVQPIEHFQSTKPVTKRKTVRQSDIVSTPYPHDKASADEKLKKTTERRDSIGAISLCSDGPIMVFSVAKQAAELQFFHEDVTRLRYFLSQTQVHTVTSWHLTATLQDMLHIQRQVAATALTSRKQFIHAFQHMCSSHENDSQQGFLGEDSVDLLHSLLEVFKREPDDTYAHENGGGDEDDEDEDDGNDLIDFGAAVCGMLVICEGSLSDKLQCSSFLLNQSMEKDSDMTQMGTLKACLTHYLMSFYGMSSSLSAEVARYSAELGANDVLQAFEACYSSPRSGSSDRTQDDSPSDPLDMDKLVSLKEFSEWFEEASASHSWLELVELEHWPSAINVCGTDSNSS